MKFVKVVMLVTLLLTGLVTRAAEADPAGHLKAVQDLMAAMQTEKMMRSITGASGFPSEAQRTAAFAKLAKIKPAEIHERLGRQTQRHISQATAFEMTQYYNLAYGKGVLYQTYNSGPGMAGSRAPTPSASERKFMSRPEFIKAKKEFDAAEPAIRHEGFLLMQAINRG
ncbi:MAG TPA: hypothetical protein VGC21_25975 [Telluria sp.]|jgi:hypothetical protein